MFFHNKANQALTEKSLFRQVPEGNASAFKDGLLACNPVIDMTGFPEFRQAVGSFAPQNHSAPAFS